MKLAIVGSRTFNDYATLVDYIASNYDIDSITAVISGGAKGADFLAERFAKEFEKDIIIFPADWRKYGKRAGFLRNIDIIKECDECVCFWDGKSHGTGHDIELCKKFERPFKVCLFNSETE